MDEAGGLYFAQARRYDAANGRFVSKDSDRYIRFSRPDSLNQYMYCYDSPLRYVDPSGNDCYYFYLPEWKDEAERARKNLAVYYGIDESEVHLIEVTDNQSFMDGWNNMGTENGQPVDIDMVVVDTHADPYGFDYGKNSKDELDAYDVQGLGDKDIDTIVLLGCNAGHLDYEDDNMAATFATKYEDTLVVASDGTVEPYDYGIDYGYESLDDDEKKHFKKWLLYGDRENKGWHIYYSIGGYQSVSPSLGKELILPLYLQEVNEIMKE